MELWIFLLIILFVAVVITYWGITFNEPDSKRNKKRFWNRVCHIEYVCCKLKVKEIHVTNKGLSFYVRVADGKGVEKINYDSPYRATDIYINEELVCKIHRLKNTFVTYITLEYVNKRSRVEIDEIIIKAYKNSKRKLNEHYKINGYGFNSNSFYNN